MVKRPLKYTGCRVERSAGRGGAPPIVQALHRKLQALFKTERGNINVFPLDNRAFGAPSYASPSAIAGKLFPPIQ